MQKYLKKKKKKNKILYWSERYNFGKTQKIFSEEKNSEKFSQKAKNMC